MGVSVRVTRNTRVYLPFLVAIPVYVAVGAALAVVLVFALIGRGITWLIRKAASGRHWTRSSEPVP